MKTTPVTVSDLRRSVLAVPPLCRNADLSLNAAENARLIAHLRAGGVTTHMWGGNANLYNMGVGEFAAFLAMAESIAEGDEWVIPSIGADFGKAMEQAAILSKTKFPTAMALPMRGLADAKGVAFGLSKVAEKAGRPLIIYYKDDGYLDHADLGAMMKDGTCCAVKYGVLRKDNSVDPELTSLLKHVDRDLVISGSGELPIVDHARHFGLRAFTSGCVCIAPRLSMQILDAISRADFARAAAVRETFLPCEHLRERHSPIRVLHAAVGLAGVAATGPVYPMLSDLTDAGALAEIRAAAQALHAANTTIVARAAE